jgi:aspartate 1-decarboxylase
MVCMHRRLLASKIHRATVTEANLDYEGSITIDADLLDAADIAPWEEVQIWDVTNGARLATYAIPGPRNSGVVCINGAAAHHVHAGDVVIIARFVELNETERATHVPTVVFVDEHNGVREIRAEHVSVSSEPTPHAANS